jgi:thiamine pyrophosphokinase
MHAAVVLNGKPPSSEFLRRVTEGSAVYAADGGALACLAAAVRPLKVVGDFDSLGGAPLPEDWVCELDSDQNTTDFEKVLSRLPEPLTSLTVLGGLGGRLDHTWNNLVIAAGLPEALKVCFLSEDESLWRVTRVCPLRLDVQSGSTVSLLPMGMVKGVCTEGLRWELEQGTLGPGEGLAQSNVALGTLAVSVQEGCLFCRNNSLHGIRT